MIYLRPSRRIKSAESDDRIIISDSLLDEYLDRLISLNADKRPFSLHLEASNGVALSEQGVTATKLSARVLTREGVDITSLAKTLSPSWQIEGKEVGQGLSYTAQAAKLKSWYTKITVMTTVARILDAMGKLDKLEQGVRRVLEEQEVKTSIELRKDSLLLQHIPTTELLLQSLKADRQFLASVKGDKGDAGQDAAPVRPNLIKKGESLYPNMGQSVDDVSVAYKEGVYRITKRGKMWRSINMYTRPLLPQKSTKTRIVSWRVVGASRPELLNESKLKSKGGRYYTVGNTNHEEQWVRGGVYANPFSGEENHWIHGDWVEFTDLKVELVEDGEPIEPTAYIPHIDDLKGDSVTLADLGIEWQGDRLTVAGKTSGSLKGERGLQGIKGADGKSVTAQEVVQQLNTSTFRDTIRDILKADAQFVSITKGLKGDPADPVRPNLLRGFLGTEKRTTSAQGSANVHARLGIKPFLERGKKYVLSADFELLEGSANAVSLGLVTTAGGFVRDTKTALNGTKTRASLYINLDDTINLDGIVDVVGYAGEHGKSRGNLARYYNIKLEDVTSDSDKASAYLPHHEDLRGIEGKSVTLADLNIQWQGDRLSVAGKTSESLKGERGLQGDRGADGKSVTPEEAVNALMQDQVSLYKIRKDILESNQATQFVSARIKKEVTQAVTLSDSSNTMRLPDIHTIEEGALYRIAIIPNGYCLLEFEVVSSQDIITPMFDNLGRQHTQKALFCEGAFALFERLGERWMWRNYCDFAYHKNKIQKELEELRLSTIENNIRALRNGAVNSFVNLGSIQSGSYHLKPSDYIIFARATGNGDKNPWIYLDDASIEVGANFFVIVPSTDITCAFKVPTGTAINGNTQVNKGLYLLIKTWATEWICTSISTM